MRYIIPILFLSFIIAQDGVYDKIVEDHDKAVKEIQNKFDRQILTEGERYNKTIDIWTHATSEVAEDMFKELKIDNDGFNPLYMMADSGARGSQDQIKQLAGMRGLMAKPRKSMVGGGEIIESPIMSNFKEGLSVMEYFISTHGARKGLADTALKTADAGYLTRRLVDVAQDVVVSTDNCKTINGITISDLKEGEEVIEPLTERILGRTSSENIIIDGEKIVLDSISYVQDKGKTEIGIETKSNKRNLIIKMFDSLNYNVISLDLVFYGGLTKKDISRNKYRFLSDEEINLLKRI